MTVVRLERHGALGLVTIDHPPLNALSHTVRRALWDSIEAADRDRDIAAIVLMAAGKTFPVGADISEFGQKMEAPHLGEVCDRIEACRKPVVAALHGSVFGGGFEVALAAHYRVAHEATQLAFPEVKLGLIPGAGGTQRAPRLAGAANALSLMLSGAPLRASHASAAPYLDLVVDDDLTGAALRFAQQLVSKRQGPRRSLDARQGVSAPDAFQETVQRQRHAQAHHPEPARLEIVRAVEAALLLPPAAGLALEREAFAALDATPQARALQHMFFADRAVQRVPGARARSVTSLGLVGGGPSAVALAMASLHAGLGVVHLAPSADAATRLLDALVTAFDRTIEAGGLTQAGRQARLDRLVQTQDPQALSPCDVIIGCGSEQARLITEAGSAARADATLVTTSLFDLTAQSPLLGLAFGSETDLAEVLWSNHAVPEDVATLLALMRRIGRVPVAQRSAAPVSQGLRQHQRDLSNALIRQGASPAAIRETALDLGLDWPVAPDPEEAGPASSPPSGEISAFLFAGVASAGMALLRSGALRRASDIDVLATHSLGYPRWTGGPMHMAQARGLLTLERDIARFARGFPALFVPDPGLDEIIKTGGTWADFA